MRWLAVDGQKNCCLVLLCSWSAGEVRVDGEIGFTLISELTAEQPQFNLTCNSTGGPATTVTWTRDSGEELETIFEETEIVLNDPVTGEYTHTLTLTGSLPGGYNCTVANSISSDTSTEMNIEGKLSQY